MRQPGALSCVHQARGVLGVGIVHRHVGVSFMTRIAILVLACILTVGEAWAQETPSLASRDPFATGLADQLGGKTRAKTICTLMKSSEAPLDCPKTVTKSYLIDPVGEPVGAKIRCPEPLDTNGTDRNR